MPVIKKRTKKGKLQNPTAVESRGVCTSRGSPNLTPITSPASLTPTHSSPTCLTPTRNTPTSFTPTHTSPPCLIPTCHAPVDSNPTILGSSVPPSGKDSPTKATQTVDASARTSHNKGNNPTKSSHSKDNLRRSHRRKENPTKMLYRNEDPSKTLHAKEDTARVSHNKEDPARTSHSKEKPRRDDHIRDDPNKDHLRKSVVRDHTFVDPASGAPSRSRGSHHPHRRHSHQELDPASRGGHGPRSSELLEASTASVKQELLHLSLARQALEAEKAELTRLLEQRESVIMELRKQMHHRDKAMHTQRAQFEDALRNVQNGKRPAVRGDSPAGRGGPREELHLVRDAIASLRGNFRETDPNQHTLDTLEQAIAILIERSSSIVGGGGGGGGGVSSGGEKASRASEKRPQVNGGLEASTKVIYFTERTVTPFMSTINRPLGDIRLKDFKNMFDRPGLFRFHFKSYDPEYGMVKEEIVNDDDILPGVEGKIIAWVEEDAE